jgi:hypothetical protein
VTQTPGWLQLRQSEADPGPLTVDDLVSAVRSRAWTFLSGASHPSDIAPVTEDLFRLQRGDLRRLAALHVALSVEAGQMLRGVERLLRELPSSVTRSRIENRGPVRQPVLWRDTYSRRIQAGDRSIFVSAPAERRYDTPLARLVKRGLRSFDSAFELAAVSRTTGGIGDVLARRHGVAQRLLRHAKLRDVRDVSTLPTHAFRGALRHRHAAGVAAFVHLYQEAVEQQAPRAVQEVVSRQLLVPAHADRVLELYVGFEIIRAFEELGYEHDRMRVLPERSLPFARLLHREGDEVRIWYQRGLTMLAPKGATGEYGRALSLAGLRPNALRPDFMVVHERTQRPLLVEVKFTESEEDAPDRIGLKDALLYLQDGRTFLPSSKTPRVLVVAWNSRAVPNTDAEVAICSQASLHETVLTIADRWMSGA